MTQDNANSADPPSDQVQVQIDEHVQIKIPGATSDPPQVDERVKFRLPRLGCFTLFFIFFFSIVGGLVLLFYAALPLPVECETPTERVTVADPCNVIHDEDKEVLTRLATEVADAGGCDVAVMFVDEGTRDFYVLFDAVLADWAPGKGVLLMYSLQNDSIRMALTGGEWRLAGHDSEELFRKVVWQHTFCRGDRVRVLLNALKKDLELAKSSELPAGVMENFGGVYFDLPLGKERSDFRYTGSLASLGLGLIAIALGLVVWGVGRATRKSCLANYKKIREEFERRKPNEPELRLSDLNEPKEIPAWLKPFHHPVMKRMAIVLAVVLGLLTAYVGITAGPEHDFDTLSREEVPDLGEAPAEAPSGIVVDLADAFTPEEERAISEAVDHLEKAVGGQVQVLTVKTIGYEVLEDYTLEVASRWEIGEAGKDNGALVFLAIDDRRNRIEVGYGWEAALTDARCGDLLRDAVPELREARYADACVKIIRGMEQYLSQSPEIDAAHSLTQKGVIAVIQSIDLPKPPWDPRQEDFLEAFMGSFGILLTLLGVVLGYWGRLCMTSLPDYVIIDPVKLRELSAQYSYSSSSSSSSSSRSRSSSRSSRSSSSSHRSSSGGRRSGGGGSFGGGGASGRW